MIAADELSDSATFFEIKRQPDEIRIETLKQKAEAFLRATYQFNGFNLSYKGLSIKQM